MKTACNITSFLFDELSERQSKAPFLCCDGTVLTIEDFQTLVVRQCNIFSASGLIQGDAVLVATGRGNDFWIDVFALWRMGAIAVPIEAANNLEELRRIAQMSRARRMLCAAAQCEGLASLGLEMIDRSRLGVQPEVPATPLPAGATAMILFTSGSTGQPKGVVLSHGAILGNALSTRERIFLRPGDRLLFVIPFRFVSALSHVLVGLLAGTEVFGFERTLMQSDFCQLIARHGCTAYGGSPLQARWIAEFMEQSGSPERAFPHLRWLMSSGDYMREELAQRLMRQGLDVIIAYGLTEVAGRLCVRHVNRERSNTVGRPIRGLAVSYVPPATPNDSDRILAVQGEFLFDGYIGDPERSISANGERFFRTGDVGDINDDGSVSLRGRADDVFKVAGNKVSCLAIAAALLELETVKEVAVLAQPYPVLGMAPHAYVVSRAGGEFDKGSALRHIRSALGSSHIPRSVTLVSRIPRTGSGKVDRRALVEMVETMKG